MCVVPPIFVVDLIVSFVVSGTCSSSRCHFNINLASCTRSGTLAARITVTSTIGCSGSFFECFSGEAGGRGLIFLLLYNSSGRTGDRQYLMVMDTSPLDDLLPYYCDGLVHWFMWRGRHWFGEGVAAVRGIANKHALSRSVFRRRHKDARISHTIHTPHLLCILEQFMPASPDPETTTSAPAGTWPIYSSRDLRALCISTSMGVMVGQIL